MNTTPLRSTTAWLLALLPCWRGIAMAGWAQRSTKTALYSVCLFGLKAIVQILGALLNRVQKAPEHQDLILRAMCHTSEAEPFAQLNRQGRPPDHNPARFFECSQAQNLSHSQLEQIK